MWAMWSKTKKSLKLTGTFEVLYLRWWVQKLLFLTVPDMIDQGNYLKPMIQGQNFPQTSVKVLKKVTKFWKNIHLEKFQPTNGNFSKLSQTYGVTYQNLGEKVTKPPEKN